MMPCGKLVGCDRPSIAFHRPSIGVRSPLPSPLLSPSIALPSAYLLSPLYPLPLEGPQRRLRWDYAAGPPSGEERENSAAAPSLAKPLKIFTTQKPLPQKNAAAPSHPRDVGLPHIALALPVSPLKQNDLRQR